MRENAVLIAGASWSRRCRSGGVVVPAEWWRPLGVGAGIVSLAGIVFFFGTWPMFNTLAALGVDVAVLVAVVWLRWPPHSLFGS